MRNNRGRGGFSIFELIIYISIFAIMGILGAFVFDYSVRSKQITSRSNEVFTNTQRMMSQMVDFVHNAVTINGASSTLNLKMSDSGKDPTVIALASGAITIKEGVGNATSVTPSALFVNSLTFTLITNPSPSTSSVRIVLTAGYAVDSAADEKTLYTLQTTAAPL